MLGDGGDEFHGAEDFEVLFVLVVSHLRSVDDFTALLLVVNLLDRKGIADDVLSQRFLAVTAI
jgi:hypothetical protein